LCAAFGAARPLNGVCCAAGFWWPASFSPAGREVPEPQARERLRSIVSQMISLAGARARVITGGSRGHRGARVAELLCDLGASVVINGRDPRRKWEEAVAAINRSGGQRPWGGGVGPQRPMTKRVAAVARRRVHARPSGRLDILINCAGNRRAPRPRRSWRSRRRGIRPPDRCPPRDGVFTPAGSRPPVIGGSGIWGRSSTPAP